MRFVLTLLLLVVVPTAVLSVLAGRSIQAREAILNRRLEQAAVQQIDGVCGAFGDLLQADASRVGDFFRETVLAGLNAEGIEDKVGVFQEQCAFVKQIFLFMHPWGFVYPSVSSPPSSEPPQSEHVLLRKDLIEHLSTGAHAQESRLYLYRAGRTYCFSPMSDFSGLHSGFEIDVPAAMDRLDGIVSAHATADIGLRVSVVEGIARSGMELRDDVQVSDSFTLEPESPEPLGAEGGGNGGGLASGSLPAPFSHVRISAFLVHEDDLRQAEALEARLIGWGILLLAVVITASSTLLIRSAMSQAALTRKRSEFVIGMSHDLRTPVASMRVLADSLCAGRVPDPDKQRHFLRTIASECERLGDMIERILFFFRQEQRAVSYTMLPFDVAEMVSHTVTAYRDRQQGRVAISLDLGDGPVSVVGDAEALAKVVTNLLDNAVKYGVPRDREAARVDEVTGVDAQREPDIEVTVRRAQRRGRDWTVISVADHGPGIPAQAHDKIFERFYRHDSETHRHVGGIGLGLSLCMDIVKAHGGRMRVESELGEGAVFSVWLRITRR